MKNLFIILILQIMLMLLAPALQSIAATPQAQQKVQLLVASWCVRCKDMEELLRELKADYEKLDVEKDPAGKDLYNQVGGGGVPILIAGKSLIRGFDRNVVTEMINKLNPPAAPIP